MLKRCFFSNFFTICSLVIIFDSITDSPQRQQPPMHHSQMHRPDHSFGRNSPLHSPSRHYQPASPSHQSRFDRGSFDAMQAKPY